MAGLSLSTTREENFTSKDNFSTETKNISIIAIADPLNICIDDSKNIWIADFQKYLYD